MRRYLLLLPPLATLVLFLGEGSFLYRSATTLLCLVATMFTCLKRPTVSAGAYVVVALFFSFAGDYVLGHWGGRYEGFVCGVLLFLLAHLGYVGFCLHRGRVRLMLFVVLTAAFGAYHMVWLRPAMGDTVTATAVFAYILVSCLSMASAAGLRTGSRTANVLFAAGIACLLFSDLLIAQRRFLHDATLHGLMFPTYFASQILVTAALLHIHRT